MKKSLFRFFTISLLFANLLAQAGPKSYIYIINNSGEDLMRGQVSRQKGQKYAPILRKRIGAPKKLKGYTCEGLFCKADTRQVFYRDKQVTIDPNSLLIKKGETVKIAEIDRNQAFLALKNFKGKLPGGYKNPDPKKFKTILWSYPVYPFEEITTNLTGENGLIKLVASSERIGLLASDYAKSIALGGVGALGGSLAPIGTGLGIIGRGAKLAAIEKAGISANITRLNEALTKQIATLNRNRKLAAEVTNLSLSQIDDIVQKMAGQPISKLVTKNMLTPETYMKLPQLENLFSLIADQTLAKLGTKRSLKLAEKALSAVQSGSLLVAVPIMIIGTIIAVGIATVSTIASLTVKAQKSGLTVLPFIEGNYKISQYLQERKGSRYPDLYITIWPK